jgi:hypothetical protein
MQHSRFDWAGRIKAAEREYQSVRVAVDWLLDASPDEIHHVTDARGWDDLAVADIYAADRNLDPTYLIRMFSVFERAVASYWRSLPGNDAREVDGRVQLDEVGVASTIPNDLTDEAQIVRIHRNDLVHRRMDEHAATMTFADSRGRLLSYLGELPETWG